MIRFSGRGGREVALEDRRSKLKSAGFGGKIRS